MPKKRKNSSIFVRTFLRAYCLFTFALPSTVFLLEADGELQHYIN